MSNVSEMLGAGGACEEAVEWAGAYEDAAQAWVECGRVDWMLWWIDQCGDTPTRHLLIADLAEDALPIYEWHVPGDHRVRACIEARRLYARGKISRGDFDKVTEAAQSAAAETSVIEACSAAEASVREDSTDAGWSAGDAAARWAVRDKHWVVAVDEVRVRQLAIIFRHYPTPPPRR